MPSFAMPRPRLRPVALWMAGAMALLAACGNDGAPVPPGADAPHPAFEDRFERNKDRWIKE